MPRWPKVPDNFGGISEDGAVIESETDASGREYNPLDAEPLSPEPEPDPEGYVRPLNVGPTLDYETAARVVGQSRVQGHMTPEPRPLRDFTPEQLGQQLEARGVDEFAPLNANVMCTQCGSRVGVFYRDVYTGMVRHQGCSPNQRRQGVQGSPRQEPQTSQGARPRDVLTSEIKREFKPPEEIV